MPGRRSRSSLFLIELIFAILFFALGSAVCVQAFAKAHTTTLRARELSFASTTVSSAANAVRYTDGSLQAVQAHFPDAFAEDGGCAVCYGRDLAPCAPQTAAYTLHIRPGTDGAARTARIWMEDAAGGELFALDLHWPATAA